MATHVRLSPAKINLTLRVIGVRPDGFHEIESLAARVDWGDTVSVSPRDDGRFTLACNDAAVPRDETNLAVRAARRLAQTARVSPRGVHIELLKRMPVGAGLGGGSSNAATTLMLLNELWETGLSSAELADIGAAVGSDVPLFFHTSPCIIRGRGEQVEDLSRTLRGWAALVLPPMQTATPEVYAARDRLPAHPTHRPAEDILRHADRPAELMPHLFNDLEGAAFAVYPGLAELAQRLGELAGGPVRMSGSGSAWFRLFDEQEEAEDFGKRVRAKLCLRTEVTTLATNQPPGPTALR